MPTYELCVLFRVMPKNELKTAIKRVANAVYDRSGILRKIENMGQLPIPYKIRAHGGLHKEAHCMLYTLDTKASDVQYLDHEYMRDVDIVRRGFVKVEEYERQPCTLHDEMLPPMYRPSVQKMLEKKKESRNPFTYKFNYNSGLDHYPFQK